MFWTIVLVSAARHRHRLGLRACFEVIQILMSGVWSNSTGLRLQQGRASYRSRNVRGTFFLLYVFLVRVLTLVRREKERYWRNRSIVVDYGLPAVSSSFWCFSPVSDNVLVECHQGCRQTVTNTVVMYRGGFEHEGCQLFLVVKWDTGIASRTMTWSPFGDTREPSSKVAGYSSESLASEMSANVSSRPSFMFIDNIARYESDNRRW